MAWIVGTTTDVTWQTGSSTVPPPTFQVLSPTTYQPATNCTLQVLGANSTFWIVWSPTSNPEDPDAVLLPIVSTDLDINGDGTVVVTARRGIVRYSEQGWIYLFQNNEAGGLVKTLTAEAGKQYVTLQAPLAGPSERITAIPDLIATDQLIWWDVLPSGTVTINSDGSFVASSTVQSFQVELHVVGEGYSDPATQTINAPTANAGWTSAPIRSHTGTLLANQTNISYAILPGHTVHAVSPIAVGVDETTDAQGRVTITGLSYAPFEPVTVILRWLEGGTIDRFIVVYTQLDVWYQPQ